MGTSLNRLPHYKNPPVIEVVLGAQFDELAGFLSVHLGLFWERVRSEYPEAEDRPPLPSAFEGTPSQQPGLELLELPPLRRSFLIHSEKNYLLQVQPTRFLHNWRKLRSTDAYPRFAAAEERFTKNWETFRQFIADNRLGPLKVNQYELTYINHIPSDGTKFPLAVSEYSHIFNWPRQRSDPFLPNPVSLGMDLRFPLPEDRGALRVNVKHGKRRTDEHEVLVLDLTARGPARNDAADMKSWFALAHEWIVRGFTDLTTPRAHAQWERTQ